MKKSKKIFVIFFIILILVCSVFFLFFRKTSEENEIKNDGKIIQKSESESEGNQTEPDIDSVEEMTEEMYENFGRDKERYTEKTIIYETDMKLVSLDSTDICKEISCDSYILKEYLTAFAGKQKLVCDCGKILDYCYAEMEDATRKIYIFVQLDDSNQTLATVIFEPATTEAAAYYDVLPCQYTLQEIVEQAWYKKEEQ